MKSERAVIPLGIYEHYSGKRYRVLGTARHSEDPEEQFVVYQALYDNPIFGTNQTWIRPYEMFLETVEINGESKPRFALITDKDKG